MDIMLFRVTDHKKQRKDKPAHKENEAIEFEFNIGVDDCSEIAMNMYKSGMLLTEDDAKKVAKMMENQITGLNKEREAVKQEHAAELKVKSLLPVLLNKSYFELVITEGYLPRRITGYP